jgi:hypothetical protein
MISPSIATLSSFEELERIKESQKKGQNAQNSQQHTTRTTASPRKDYGHRDKQGNKKKSLASTTGFLL